ncbi:MAG: FliH/SctL family protein [Candidatus Melainabacteria bacterium]
MIIKRRQKPAPDEAYSAPGENPAGSPRHDQAQENGGDNADWLSLPDHLTGGEPVSAGRPDELQERRRERPNRRAEDRERRNEFRRVEDKVLISRAQEEAGRIRENAYQEGFQQGLDDAEAAMTALREELGKVFSARDEALHSVADDIAGLAMEVAERIIKTEVSCDESLILSLVHDTIQKSGARGGMGSQAVKSILVKVHPDDLALVKQDLKNNPPENLKAEILVMDDPTIARGSCVVETASGLVDASFTTQLEILKKLFGLST